MERALNENKVLVSALKKKAHRLSLEYQTKHLQWLGKKKAQTPASTSQHNSSSSVLPEPLGSGPSASCQHTARIPDGSRDNINIHDPEELSLHHAARITQIY